MSVSFRKSSNVVTLPQYSVDTKDAQEIFNNIVANIDNKIVTILDFKDCTNTTYSFLNTSIGQLLGKYSYKYIEHYVQYLNATNRQLDMIINTIDNATAYFENKYKQNLGGYHE